MVPNLQHKSLHAFGLKPLPVAAVAILLDPCATRFPADHIFPKSPPLRVDGKPDFTWYLPNLLHASSRLALWTFSICLMEMVEQEYGSGFGMGAP